MILNDEQLSRVQEALRDVANLIDCYQRDAMKSADRLRAVRELLAEYGCLCECEHLPEEHDDCERCLACRIGEAVQK